MENSPNNKYRSLGQIAVVNAWFDPVETNSTPRYRFHMDVSFREERLGGEEGDPVRFRVALLQCEVAVVLPDGEANLVIDPRSIASDQANTMVSRSRERVSSRSAEGSASTEIGPTSLSGGLKATVSGNASVTDTVTTQGSTTLLLGRRSRTEKGDLSWIVTCAEESGILNELVWNARTDPRFDLIDNRKKEIRERDARNQLHPTIRVEIICRREDLRIEDIALTDPNDRKSISPFGGDKKRRIAAEAFIKRELLQNGLRAGNIHEPYGRLVVSDMIVSLVDDAQQL